MAEAPWLTIARALIGTRETAGPGNNPAIMAWAKQLGPRLGAPYAGDATPWCGLFVAHCMADAGLPLPAIPVRALAWSAWGQAVTPCVGAVLVFKRPEGGHVGLYVGEDDEAFNVLGGNQGDTVSVSRIEKGRMVAARWPAGLAVTGSPLRLSKEGRKLSKNEA
jgi:uncharacterized protein (TIGR02594 family)